MRLLRKSGGFGCRVGAAIGNNIYKNRVRKILKQERGPQTTIAKLEARDVQGSEDQIRKYEAIMLDMLETDLV